MIDCKGSDMKEGLYKSILYGRYQIGSACGEGENGSIYNVSDISWLSCNDCKKKGKLVMKFASDCDSIALEIKILNNISK